MHFNSLARTRVFCNGSAPGQRRELVYSYYYKAIIKAILGILCKLGEPYYWVLQPKLLLQRNSRSFFENVEIQNDCSSYNVEIFRE